MSEAYKSLPLTAQTADMTYPLVQMLKVDMSFDRWRAFVDQYCMPVAAGSGDIHIVRITAARCEIGQRAVLWPRQPLDAK